MKRFWVLAALLLVFAINSSHAAVWFGEENGYTLHRDPFCRSRGLNIPNPFAQTFEYENEQTVSASGEWLVCTRCYTDSFDHPVEPFPEDFSSIWNASLEAKAAMLPVPSEHAIFPEEAYQTAKECAASNPELSQYLNAEGLCTVSVFHYDAAGTHATEQRETYKALVTTPLREPIGVIMIDDITGAVYGTEVIPYEDFENLYSKEMKSWEPKRVSAFCIYSVCHSSTRGSRRSNSSSSALVLFALSCAAACSASVIPFVPMR